MTYKVIVSTIPITPDQRVLNFGLAAGYDDAYNDCVFNGEYFECHDRLKPLLDLDTNKFYEKGYKEVINDKTEVDLESKFNKIKKGLRDSLFK